MANNKSAKKRIIIAKRNRLENRFYKKSVRTLIKTFLTDVEIRKNKKDGINKKTLNKQLSLIYSLLDKGTKKNVFHRNASARKKSQLANSLKQAVI